MNNFRVILSEAKNLRFFVALLLRMTVISLFLIFNLPLSLHATELMEITKTKIIVREHPKTGKPYVSIISSDVKPEINPFGKAGAKFTRPDYRMLDPKVKAKDIPYNGPYSDRKKVYILAATLATVGTVGGVVGFATAPAVTAASSGAGAGLYAAGGTAIAGGTISTALIKSQPDPHRDDFSHKSKTELEEMNGKKF